MKAYGNVSVVHNSNFSSAKNSVGNEEHISHFEVEHLKLRKNLKICFVNTAPEEVGPLGRIRKAES